MTVSLTFSPKRTAPIGSPPASPFAVETISGSTFGGNPVCAAGAISIVSRIDDEFLKSVREKSEYIKNFLMNIKGVKSVSGMGLMLGVETQKDAKQIASECLENGLLVLTAKTKIRLLPALNISYLELSFIFELVCKI